MKSNPGMAFRTGLAEDSELPAILELQRANLAASADGFVSVVHTLDILRTMGQAMPHVVARGEGPELAGYALSMVPAHRSLLPILDTMFARLDQRKERLGRYYVMGQICVAQSFRGSGVFDALYAEHRLRFGAMYDCVVTEISARNARSLRAHARVGFVEEERYRDDTDCWVVVALRF